MPTADWPAARRPWPRLALLTVEEGLLAASPSLVGALRSLGGDGTQLHRLETPARGRLELAARLGDVALLEGPVHRDVEQLGGFAIVEPGGGDAMKLSPALPAALPDGLAPFAALLQGLRLGGPIREGYARLVDQALEVWARPGFDVFISLSRLHFTPYEHQLHAAAAALQRMRGRAILADEVGLGKTIEAGLVLSELHLRGLAAHTLVLLPAGLVGQWSEELHQKFALPFLTYGTAAWDESEDPLAAPLVLASIAAARRSPLRERLEAREWDLVIVDEAHRLKNPRSASAMLVKGLPARYMLLLTATPVENRLDDLYQLVNLVRPGHLGTPGAFKARHRASEGGQVAHLAELQQAMRDVMVRHRRSEVALMLPRRVAETLRVPQSAAEAELYLAVSRQVRDQARGASSSALFALRQIQRLAGSSPRALAGGLARMGWPKLAAQAAAVGGSEKARALLLRLRHHAATGEKVVVFTAFRDTLAFLAAEAAREGLPATLYHGGLTRREKDEAIRSFQAGTDLLLTTEAAGEGRNLQFCHVMINYDLPWNPMQIEQRLGRIHRIGQTEDVLLTNLVARGTLEERILGVLETKINLFELVVGELDMILGRIEDDLDLESLIFASYVESGSDEEFQGRLDELGERLVQARAAYLESRGENDLLLGEADAP